MVRLRVPVVDRISLSDAYFNSSVVRLRDVIVGGKRQNSSEFQFQCGAIEGSQLSGLFSTNFNISIPVWCD